MSSMHARVRLRQKRVKNTCTKYEQLSSSLAESSDPTDPSNKHSSLVSIRPSAYVLFCRCNTAGHGRLPLKPRRDAGGRLSHKNQARQGQNGNPGQRAVRIQAVSSTHVDVWQSRAISTMAWATASYSTCMAARGWRSSALTGFAFVRWRPPSMEGHQRDATPPASCSPRPSSDPRRP